MHSSERLEKAQADLAEVNVRKAEVELAILKEQLSQEEKRTRGMV